MKKKIAYIALALTCAGVLMGFTYSKQEGGRIPTDTEEMRILNFNGHRYVCYRYYYHSDWNLWGHKGRAGTSGASIVHDPDCPCSRK